MKSNVFYSDEILNAYIDNELQHSDYSNISAALAVDSELRTRVEELRVVRSLVQISYKKIDFDTDKHAFQPGPNRLWQSIAASIILVVGLTAGWLANQYSASPTLLELAQTIESRASSKLGKNNIMLHLSTSNRYRWKIVLDEIEQTLVSAEKKHSKVNVHLVTNGDAINVARLENNPFSTRIQRLMEKYPNFSMQVCRQTLERLYYSKKKKVKLLPGAEVVQSALGEVIKKRRQGWLYLKI